MADPTLTPSKLCHIASQVTAFSLVRGDLPCRHSHLSSTVGQRDQHRNRCGLRTREFPSLLRVGTHRGRHIMCMPIHARVERHRVGWGISLRKGQLSPVLMRVGRKGVLSSTVEVPGWNAVECSEMRTWDEGGRVGRDMQGSKGQGKEFALNQ